MKSYESPRVSFTRTPTPSDSGHLSSFLSSPHKPAPLWIRVRQVVGNALLCVVGLGCIISLGCGSKTSGGTDTSTDWMKVCSTDADCSEALSCHCKVCTKRCASDSSCSQLSETAQCLAVAEACGEFSTCSDKSVPITEPQDCEGENCEPDASSCDAGDCESEPEALPDGSCDPKEGACGPRIVCSAASCNDMGTCQAQGPVSCGEIYNPVCGCDGVTYDNPCSAQTTIAYEGECNSETTPEPDDSSSPESLDDDLCNGSPEIRFIYNIAGGAVGEEYSFFNTGHALVAIDGLCQFWVIPELNGKVLTGTLPQERAAELAEPLSHGHIADYASFESSGCPDGSTTRIWDSSGSAECICGCDSDAPEGLSTAMSVSSELIAELVNIAEPATGPLRLYMRLTDAAWNDVSVPWPLDRAASEFEAPGPAPGEEFVNLNENSGVTFTNSEDLTQLRSARDGYRATPELGGLTPSSVVFAAPDADAGMLLYHAYLRDELPETVRGALDAVWRFN